MITKRIIPCLDVKNGRVVKGVNFAGLQDMADPVEMARYYNASGADELVFYDITASVEGRGLFTDILRQVASQLFIPLTVGGGINTLDDFDRVLKCGADKVSVNSGAIRNPGIIPAAAQKYGNQCVVLSADIKRVDGKFMLFAKGGRENTGMDALDWLEQGVKNGAGELVVNSIDTDGVKNGFDLELLDAVERYVAHFDHTDFNRQRQFQLRQADRPAAAVFTGRKLQADGVSLQLIDTQRHAGQTARRPGKDRPAYLHPAGALLPQEMIGTPLAAQAPGKIINLQPRHLPPHPAAASSPRPTARRGRAKN